MFKPDFVYETLYKMFPDASCELVHKNNYELLICIILSAQTTDKMVNKVTPRLFQEFPDFKALSEARFTEVLDCIKTLGLSRSKATNIIACAKRVMEVYDGKIPNLKKELITLPGVGNKTANVFMAVGLGIQAFGVDTHVMRVSKHLRITKSDNPLIVEKDLMKFFKNYDWIKLHHLMIFFGRYHCSAKKPDCNNCPFKDGCLR